MARNLAGYTPIGFSLSYGYSTIIMAGVETFNRHDGAVYISGFARSSAGEREVTFMVHVIWLKNN